MLVRLYSQTMKYLSTITAGHLTNAFLVMCAFIRFVGADDTFSFDYRHYIVFINEVGKLSLQDFVGRMLDGFPYFPWADAGEFEIGFAILVYLFPSFLSAKVVYASIAVIALLIKLEVLRRLRVPIYVLVLMFIFFVTLFEGNALRAGVSLSFLMLAIFGIYRGWGIALVLWLLITAIFFHVSSAAAIFFTALGIIIYRTNPRIGILVFGLLLGLFFPANLEKIAPLIGGKVEEYVILTESFDLYSGASGINASSVMAIFFVIFFLLLISISREAFGDTKYLTTASIGLMFAYGAGSLVLFSGMLAVIGDRIWQLALPIALAIMYSGYFGLKNDFKKSGDVDSLLVYRTRFIALKISGIAVFCLLNYLILINICIRYPQTNFFSFVMGEIELKAPTKR